MFNSKLFSLLTAFTLISNVFSPNYRQVENEDRPMTDEKIEVIELETEEEIEEFIEEMTEEFLKLPPERQMDHFIDMVKRGIDPNELFSGGTLMHMAAFMNDIQALEVFILAGGDVNVRDEEYEDTPLHIAAWEGNLEIARVLIKEGSSINSLNNSLSTPLHYAVFNDHLQLVKELIKSGADVSLSTKDGKTAYQISIDKGHNEITKILLENGAR